tara:strand:- start:329 stop:2806 length:2478 start_codon:yes stop_codon:yes gene_type:complete
MNTLTKFAYTFSISKIVKDDRGKKTPIGMPMWSKFKNPSECIINKNDKVLCVITGLKNNISVIDCDTMLAYENIIKEFPVLENTYTVKTSRGFHIYVLYNPKAKTTTNAYLNIDVRSDGGMVFGAGTKTEFNTEYTIHKDLPLVDAPIEVWTYLCLRKAKNLTNEPRVNLIDNDHNMTPYTRDILQNIDVLYWDEYNDWIRLVWAIKNHFGSAGYELAKELSEKSDNFDEDAFNKLWNNGGKGNSWGTIEHYSKLSNEREHINIKLKYTDKLNDSLDLNFNDMSIGKCVIELINDEVFLKDGIWYLYEEEYEVWTCIETPDEIMRFENYIYTIAHTIYSRAFEISRRKLKELDNESEDFDKEKKRCAKIGSLILKIGDVSRIQRIAKAVKMLLCRVKNDIKLNNNPNLFCFDDKTIDLITGKEYQRNKYDYITITCGYAYKKATRSEYNTIDTILKQVFPNPEIRKTYASILFKSLTGEHIEKFVICNGKGRNGKGVINEQLAATLGGKNNYYYKGKISTITEKLGSGATPEIADMNNKRVAIFTEPEEHMSLYVATVKALTGDSEMTARKLYTNSSEVNLKFLMMLECNKIPKINGTIGIAEIERFIVVEFNSLFLDSITESVINPSNVGNKHPVNEKLKNTDHQDIHKHAFFEWIMTNAPKDLYVAECVKDKTKSYLQSCDDIISFLDETIEYVGYDVEDINNQYYVSSKDLFQLFKESTIYLNMNKMEKRKYNYVRFKEDLRTNQKFAEHYVEKCYKGGVARKKNNILLGWKMKEGNDEDDDDDDNDHDNNDVEEVVEVAVMDIIEKHEELDDEEFDNEDDE